MQVGFYFDQNRCIGCSACVIACKDWNDVPAGPERWMRINYNEEGKFPNIFVSYIINPCFHCKDPVCIPVCPVNAITKREEDGIVIVNSDLCLGNEECDSKCLKACPYNAPQFGLQKGAKMRKCNFCVDKYLEGKLPVCVETCRTRALDAGILEELESKYGDIKEADNFKFSTRTNPAIIFKPKRKN
ncbi:MAG: 4Fe-4S dicluster domain-containing protein [Promethearchaeota archaeon]